MSLTQQAVVTNPTQVDFLHVGDLIMLEEGSSPRNLVSSEGHDADSQVVIEEPLRGHSESTIFLVRAQQNYRYEKQLRRELEANDMSRAKARSLAEYADLFAAAENEARINDLEFVQKQGSDVRYGMVVQLQHYISGRHMYVSRTRSESGDGCKVAVDANAGESGWFRISPRLKVHSEGERVHVGDPVVFESMQSGLVLSIYDGRLVHSSPELHAPRKEITAIRGTSAAHAFRIQLFRGFADHARQYRCLLGGQPLRLHHKEAEAPLSGGPDNSQSAVDLQQQTEPSKPSRSTKVIVAAEGRSGSRSVSCSDTIFFFHRIDPNTQKPLDHGAGNALPWESTFQLVQASTGLLLAVESTGGISGSAHTSTGSSVSQQSSSAALLKSPSDTKLSPSKTGLRALGSSTKFMSRVARAKAPGRVAELGAKDAAELPIMLCESDSTTIEQSLFELEPQYDASEPVVGIEKYFFFRHVASGRYVHLNHMW